MDIYEAIRDDHEEVRDLMEKLESSSQPTGKNASRLFNRLKETILIHMDAEENVFYPILLDEMDYREDALEAIEEHNLVKQLLHSLEETPRDDERYRPRFTVLRELFEHHIEEEEEDLFDNVQDILGEDETEGLGKQFLTHKQRAKKTAVSELEEEAPEEEEIEEEEAEEEDVEVEQYSEEEER